MREIARLRRRLTGALHRCRSRWKLECQWWRFNDHDVTNLHISCTYVHCIYMNQDIVLWDIFCVSKAFVSNLCAKFLRYVCILCQRLFVYFEVCVIFGRLPVGVYFVCIFSKINSANQNRPNFRLANGSDSRSVLSAWFDWAGSGNSYQIEFPDLFLKNTKKTCIY